MKHQLLLFVALLAVTNCQRISLIGSHFIPIESKYKAFLSTNKLESGSSVNVTLYNKEYSRSVYFDSFDENWFEPIEFKLPKVRSSDYFLKIESNSDNKCFHQSVKIKNLKDNPITLIYLDKPIYKPGDTLTFRVFLLGQDLLPFSGNLKVDVRFYDSKSVSIQNFTDVLTTNFGFAEKSFKIPETKTYGDWKIEVQANSRKISKTFKVQRENEANFNVFLNMSDTIAYVDGKFLMTILTRAENDKVFEGTAKISVKAKTWGSNQYEINKIVKTVNLLGNKNDILLKIQDDLGIITSGDDVDLTFLVEVTENSSQNTIKIKKEVQMKQKGRSVIQVVRKTYFKPGFIFPIKVRVKIMNGQPDNSLNLLKMTVEFKTSDGITKIKKDSVFNLENGETSATLTPAADTHSIRIFLEIGGSTLVENVQKFTTYGIDEFMQVSFINKSSKVGDTIQLQAHTTGELETLNLLVFGTNGLIYSEEFPEAIGKDIYNFNFQLSEEMKPEIRGLVFYIRPSDGIMVYDEFILRLGFSINNFLEISAPAHAKPNEEIEVTVKSEPDSFILLTGIDQNAELFNHDNEISRNDVYNELTYYQNFTIPNVHEYKFEKVNSYVLEPLQKGTKCGKRQPQIPSSSDFNDVKAWTQKYFPNVWFDKVFVMESGTKTLKIKVPNEVKTWRIYGVTVHQTKGFTVAKMQPEVVVRGDFAVNIKAPSTVKEGEVFQVDLSAYSFVAGTIHPTIDIEVENGYLVNKLTQEDSGKVCHYFETSSRSYFEFSKQLSSEKMTQIERFYVKSNWNDEIKIKAKSWLSGTSYESVKKIIVTRIEQESPNNYKINIAVETVSNDEANIVIRTEMESHTESSLVMEVELPTGYRYVSHGVAYHIENAINYPRQNMLKFILHRMDTYTVYKNTIRISRVLNVYEHTKSMIKIYDANRPDQQNLFSYIYDVNLKMCQAVAEARKCTFLKFWKCFG
ncbi:hypothetical protein ACKWTF_014235 [Chironomus riparius]